MHDLERDVGIAAFNRVIRDGLRRAWAVLERDFTSEVAVFGALMVAIALRWRGRSAQSSVQ